MFRLTFLFALITSYGLAQDVQPKLVFSEVVMADSVVKDELFNRASTWFAKAFNSSKDVIQKNDKGEGVIIGKAGFRHYMTGMAGENIGDGILIKYVITVSVKDRKYKYDIADFVTSTGIDVATAGPKNGFTKKFWQRAQQNCTEEAATLIKSLKDFMSKSSDW